MASSRGSRIMAPTACMDASHHYHRSQRASMCSHWRYRQRWPPGHRQCVHRRPYGQVVSLKRTLLLYTAITVTTAATAAWHVAIGDMRPRRTLGHGGGVPRKIEWYKSDAVLPLPSRPFSSTPARLRRACLWWTSLRTATWMWLSVITAHHVVWYTNNAGGTSTHFNSASYAATGLNRPYHHTTADINGDGYVDVVIASYGDDCVYVAINNGANPPTFNKYEAGKQLWGAMHVQTADIDGDGAVDLLCATDMENKVTWFQNDGATTPAFVAHVASRDLSDPACVFPADIDGDGDMDIVAVSQRASPANNRVVWYENKRIQAQQRIPTLRYTEESCAVAPDSSGHVNVPYGWANVPDRAFAGCLALRGVTLSPQCRTSAKWPSTSAHR